MFFYANQPVVVAFNNVALTSAYTGNRYSLVTKEFAKLSLDVKYTRGAGEAASKLFFQLEHSPEETPTNWYSLVIDETTTTSVLTAREWEISASGAGGSVSLNVLVDIAYKNMRISLKETGVVTNAGTATVTTVLSGL